MLLTIGPTPTLVANRRSVLKKYTAEPTLVPGKPLPTYRVPRMPTEKDIIAVCCSYFIA